MNLQQLFETYYEMLCEANYNNMFDPELQEKMTKLVGRSDFDKRYKTHVEWAKRHLKKNDRIVWFLRWTNLWFLHQFELSMDDNYFTQKLNANEKAEFNSYIKTRIGRYNKKTKGRKIATLHSMTVSPEKIEHDLEHFLSLDIASIQNYVFEWEYPDEITEKFEEYEREWRETRKRMIPYDKDKTVFLKLDSTFEWIDLESASCPLEGGAMGHCGNSPASRDSNQTILSLREKVDVSGEIWWKPHATFIYHKNEKSLGEMKGVYNKKPKKEHHKYIVELLYDKRIRAIHGGGYLEESNFSLNDLPDAIADKLITKKPALLSPKEYLERFGMDKYIKEHGEEHFMEHIGLDWYIEERGVDKFVIDGLEKAGVKFSGANRDLLVHTFTDIEDLVEDYGDSNAKYVISVFNGSEFIDTDWITDSAKYDALSSEQEKKLEAYAQKKYPEEMEELDDWKEVLEDNEEDIIEELDRAYRDATTSGIEASMMSDLESGYENGMKGNYNDIEFFFLPVDLKFDTPIKVWIERSEWESDLKDQGVSDFESAADYLNDLLSNADAMFVVEQPYHGWDGFDDEHWNSEVNGLIKDLK